MYFYYLPRHSYDFVYKIYKNTSFEEKWQVKYNPRVARHEVFEDTPEDCSMYCGMGNLIEFSPHLLVRKNNPPQGCPIYLLARQ